MPSHSPTDGRPNVLQVCTYYYPFTGGLQRVVRDLLTGIEDVNFRVLTCRTRGLGGVDERHGAKVVRVGSLGALKSTPLTPGFPYRLRQQLQWADLVHYHLPFPVGPVSQLLNRGDDTPYVVTFHDDIVGKGPVVYPYEPVLRRFLSGAERIIVTSPQMRDECERLAGYREKATVVPIGIDPPESDGDGADAVEPRALDGRRLLFVGRLVGFKGVDYLVTAMREVDATLSIVGKGPEREALEQRARNEGVTEKVRFEGFVSEERLARLYERATVFVLPSSARNESFGIVQLEAMQHGLPVVNTALPTGVPFVSVDGQTGLTVPPRDPGALADAVESLLADPERYRRFSENAQRRVRDRFTRRGMLEDTRAVYRDALAE